MALKNVTNAQIVDALRLIGYGDDVLGGADLTGAQNSTFRSRIVGLGIHDADFNQAKNIARQVGDEKFNAGGNQVGEIIAALQRRGVGDDIIRQIVATAIQSPLNQQQPGAGAQISQGQPGAQTFDVDSRYAPQSTAIGGGRGAPVKVNVAALLDAAGRLNSGATESVRKLMTATPNVSTPPAPGTQPPTAPPGPAPAASASAPAAAPATNTRSQTIALQQALNAKGAGLVVDGIMGPKTQAAAAKYGVSTPGAAKAAPASPTTAPAAGGPQAPTKLAPGASFADQVAFLKTNYGYSAWVLDDPELRPIFEQAAREGWDKSRLLGALTPTKFWQTHGDTQRLKIEEKNGDPATYLKNVATTKGDVVATAGRLGITIDPARLDQIATDAYESGWSGNQVAAAVGAEFHYDPNAARQPGEVGNLKQLAASYLVPLDDTTIDQWGRDILSGKVGDPEFTEYLKGVAKGLFPTMKAGIDAGQTVAQLVAPYRSTIAQTLEIDPNTVDFMDPKWQRLLSSPDPKTNQPVMKPLYDATTELRSNPIYNFDKTSQAKAQAAQFSQLIGQTWGVI